MTEGGELDGRPATDVWSPHQEGTARIHPRILADAVGVKTARAVPDHRDRSRGSCHEVALRGQRTWL
jgi:hypothetical protein